MAENVRRVYEIDVKLAAAAVEELRKMQAAMKELEEQAKNAGKGTKSFFDVLGAFKAGGQLAAIGAIGSGFTTIKDTISATLGAVKNFSAGVLEIQGSLERLRLGIATVTPGGLSVVGDTLEYIRTTAKNLGVDFSTTATSFVKLTAATRGTALQGNATRDIFESIAAASRNLGLTTDQTGNAFRAIEQIISKGVVQQEELRGQLSEALPGAYQIAARAVNLTTSELNALITSGKLFSEDFIPKFAAQVKKELGSDLGAALSPASLALVRIKSSYEQLLQSITDSDLGRVVTNITNTISDAFDKASVAIIKSTKAGDNFFLSLLKGGAAGVTSSDDPTTRLKEVAKELENIEENFNLGKKRGNTKGGLEDQFGFKERIAEYRILREQVIQLNQLQTSRDNKSVFDQGGVDSSDAKFLAGAAARTRAERGLLELRKDYKDVLGQQKKDLADLEAARAAGLLSGEKEYEQIKRGILARKQSATDGERLSERQLKQSKDLTDRFEAELAVQRDKGTADEAGSKLTKLRTELEEQYGKAISEKTKNQLISAEAILYEVELETKAAAQREAVLKVNKELAKSTEDLTDKLEKELETDIIRLETYGKSKEQIDQIKEAKYDLARAEVELQLKEELGGENDQVRIATYTRLIKLYKDLADAKQGVREKEIDEEGQRQVRDAEKREAESIQRTRDALRESLIDNYKSNGGNIGKAFFDTLQDELERKALKVIVEPLTEPFIDLMQDAINEVGKYLAQVLREASSTSSGEGGGFGGIIGAIGSFFTSANGNVMTDAGPARLGKFAKGGIARGPMLSMFGEGRQPEAYVPLPDGRSIPVTMQGGGGGGPPIVNIYSSGNADEVSSTTSKNANGQDQVDVYLDKKVRAIFNKDIASGSGVAKTMESRYGLRRV